MLCCQSLAKYDKSNIDKNKKTDQRAASILSHSSEDKRQGSYSERGSNDSWAGSSFQMNGTRNRLNTVVDDGIIGDPMELKLFRFIEGQFIDISQKEENVEKVVMKVKRNLKLDNYYDNQGISYDEVF